MVGVDSGQVMITDPCYIDSEWKGKTEPSFDRKVMDTKTKKVYEFGVDFSSYEEKIEGDTVNNHLVTGRFKPVPPKRTGKGEYSYRGVCDATLNNKGHAGQLNYKMGHAGAGVVASSGYGDGSYPVYAHYVDACEGDIIVGGLYIDFFDSDTVKVLEKFFKAESKK